MRLYHFIVLEGLDCSGKTTVSKELAGMLQPCKQMAFPDRTSNAGQIIDQFLKSKDGPVSSMDPSALHLLYSADRYEKAKLISDTLKASNIICDRYWFSGTAYSVAKGLDYEWCKNVDSNLPRPDYVFFIDVDAETVASRKGFGEEAHDKVDFQRKVYKAYRRLIKEEHMISIDGNRSTEEIAKDIIDKIRRKKE